MELIISIALIVVMLVVAVYFLASWLAKAEIEAKLDKEIIDSVKKDKKRADKISKLDKRGMRDYLKWLRNN